jgi:hypothetical protein
MVEHRPHDMLPRGTYRHTVADKGPRWVSASGRLRYGRFWSGRCRPSHCGMPVRLNEFRPECGNRFCVSQAIEFRGPIDVTAPIAIDSLVGQAKVIVAGPTKRLENNIHSPARFVLILYGKTVVREPILRAIIHDSHGAPHNRHLNLIWEYGKVAVPIVTLLHDDGLVLHQARREFDGKNGRAPCPRRLSGAAAINATELAASDRS